MEGKDLTSLEADKMQRYLIAKDNQFIKRSFYEYTVMEQRLIACAISTIDSRKKIDIDDDTTVRCEFDIDVFCELCGIERRSAITYLRGLVEGLIKKGGYYQTEKRLDYIHWVADSSFDLENNLIILWLSRTVKPYLLNLDADFTEYKLPMILRFKNKYSNLIFDLIYAEYGKGCYIYGTERRYSSGTLSMSVDDMKMRVRTKREKNKTVNQNISFKDLRIHILEPSIEDINEYTDIMVDIEYLTKGRKTETILFHYRPKTKAELSKVPLFRGKRIENL